MRQGLYAITDSTLTPDSTLLDQVEQALRGGAMIVQYRDKSDQADKRLRQATELAQLCRRYQRPLLINDDVQLALDSGADGVHLGQTDGSLEQARQRLGNDAIIGITCHDSLELAQQAQQGGADYVAFGAFFSSATKPDARPAPMSLLTEAKQQLSVPVVAIGGINRDNAGQLIEQGADMIAVIGDLFGHPDVQASAQVLSACFASE
ncbi:thiamine phosphate synthase [Motiliproteus coralliicola]|uniref:Thiamine-phosphate synthase n=1 Tax=Motiliproteus coralliicola TaxID=2283196 RepID=A0A369WA10_9GAMM|nr:thiamine phosphate synthase [Motiliproteus coralliicola]RDE18019.1 thiamine phosphate synthase [Motiliproteus coralliicola]